MEFTSIQKAELRLDISRNYFVLANIHTISSSEKLNHGCSPTLWRAREHFSALKIRKKHNFPLFYAIFITFLRSKCDKNMMMIWSCDLGVRESSPTDNYRPSISDEGQETKTRTTGISPAKNVVWNHFGYNEPKKMSTVAELNLVMRNERTKRTYLPPRSLQNVGTTVKSCLSFISLIKWYTSETEE